LFSFVEPQINKEYNGHEWEKRLVRLPVSSIQYQDGWVAIEVEYEASGLERFVSIGSFNQEFSLKDASYLKNLWVDQVPNPLPINSSYFLDEFSINEADSLFDHTERIWSKNHIEKIMATDNYILNGGFESFESGKIREPETSISGQQIADNWSSFNENMPILIRNDSNERRISEDDFHTYMGNGAIRLKMLKTNRYHRYGVSIDTIRYPQEGYNTYKIYERETSVDPSKIKRYHLPSFLVSALRDSLIVGEEYIFETLCELSPFTVYGCSMLDVYFVGNVPENEEELRKMNPSFSVSLADVNSQIGFQHVVQSFLAKGGERFVIMGYQEQGRSSVVHNPNFKRKVYSTCGPKQYGNCYNQIITYSDSLFAEYSFDNVMLQPVASRKLNSTVYNGKNNQLQIFYGAIDKKNEEIVTNFESAKELLFELTELLILNDGICAADLTRKKDVYLEPVGLSNKKKILRKLDKPRPKKKDERYAIDSMNLLLTGLDSVRFNNHIILISDGSVDWSSVELKLKQFINRGGVITMLYSGTRENELTVKNEFLTLGSVTFIPVYDTDAWDKLARQMVRK
jgi:hypothetical protein